MTERDDKNPTVDTSTPYWTVSPLDFRYYASDPKFLEELYPYASEDAFIRYQLKVEAALASVLADWQICTVQQAREIIAACGEVTAKDVYEEESKVHHVVRALAYCIQNRVSDEVRPYVHLFATSNDITDTANALRFKELTNHVILPDLIRLETLLIELARKHADVPQIGRTHGKHAEPITFGFALALYVSRFAERMTKIAEGAGSLRGKFAGSVGAYNAISLVYPTDPAQFERELLAKLGLRPAEGSIATQVVIPEYLTDLAYAIVSCFGVLANLADDIRHLHRSELREVYGVYDVEDVSSSTMPHKVNPKNFEHVKSMWKGYMPRMITVFMDQISEHQRDLTNSASGRLLIETFVAFDYSVRRMISALQKISINTDRMREILEGSKDSIVAEPLYVLLAKEGFPEAYRYVRKLVNQSAKSGRLLTELIWEDEEIQPILRKLKPDQVAVLRDPSKYTGAAYQRTIAVCENAEVQMRLWKKNVSKERKATFAEGFSSLLQTE